MPRAFILSLLVTTLACAVYTQKPTNDVSGPGTRRAPGSKKASRSQTLQLTAELTRQQKFLGDVAARYEAVSVHDLTPLLSYSYVWNALRENRLKLAGSNQLLTPAQAKLIEQGYDSFETELLLQFVEQQLGVLHETLELDESQYDEIEKVLSVDLNKKRALLTATSLTPAQFAGRLSVVSEVTEGKIVSILYPEQRKKFYRHLNFNRDRLIG